MDSLNLTELKGKKLFLKILQTVKKFLLLQKLGENFQSFHFCSWSKQRSTHTPFFFFLLMHQKIIKSTHLWWWWIAFVVWLTGVRPLTLFPAGNIVRNLYHPGSIHSRINFCGYTNHSRRWRTIHKPIRLFPSNLDRGRQNTISQFFKNTHREIKLSKKIQILVESMRTEIFKVCL